MNGKNYVNYSGSDEQRRRWQDERMQKKDFFKKRVGYVSLKIKLGKLQVTKQDQEKQQRNKKCNVDSV